MIFFIFLKKKIKIFKNTFLKAVSGRYIYVKLLEMGQVDRVRGQLFIFH
jgi:hypothetical protein